MVNWTITSEPFSWIDISNPDAAELQTISETYNLHKFVLKDCLEPDHLPKHEDLTDFQFIITRILNH
jgi:magnesium transporter